MVLCMGYMGRLGAVGLRASQPVLTPSARCLSTIGLQHSRLVLARSEFRSLHPGARCLSLWPWAKSSTPASTQAQPESSVPVDNSSADALSAPEPVPAEATTATDATAPATASPAEAVLPPDVPISTESLPVDLASSIPPPLNYGDLAALGLASWTPAGLCRWTMELVNVSTGLPWVWTIVATTILSRVILFPFTVKQMQSTAALAPYQNDVAAIRDEMAAAQKRKDMIAMQRAALKQKMIYEKAGVSLGGMALAPFIQLPVTLGMFFGVKKLCDLPLEQLQHSGFAWISDLTVADPTWALPIIATVMMNVQISVSMRDLVGQTPQMGHIMNFLRILTTGSVFLMANLSSGVVVYLLTSITAMTFQSLLLRQPAVRRMLGIPLIPKHLRTSAPSMRESYVYARKWINDKISEARVEAKRR
ncbi:hypothetical protein L226DRAFT_505197 [Lentinus tigrinus ALCF2SS1-7]|uniref:Membrane insertase YidC/Oxa/ALB C-terminal domain-containing protein n=1 Tax=Lentinus tigrinus ALCF2SS1-6 TaxID=1328759 RepID=A0A5C2SH78_9APHY|nr:hypothetical protein L227DRAFT_546943 [Lentinus tigrinus ALCF2SS1-6]RPD77129.1 hypothetical protein L226DRAFT_505197 [Lentinus tigrinus ALCF2SS1-7]